MKFGYEHEIDLLRSCVVELETDLAAARVRIASLEAERDRGIARIAELDTALWKAIRMIEAEYGEGWRTERLRAALAAQKEKP